MTKNYFLLFYTCKLNDDKAVVLFIVMFKDFIAELELLIPAPY